MGRRAGTIRPAAFALLLALLPAARQACAQTVIVMSNTRGLDFGRFAAGTGGTVVLNAATGARTKTGSLILLNSPSAAQATYNGPKSTNGTGTLSVVNTLPANNTVQLSSGANHMYINNFVSSPATISSVPNGSGLVLSVGATLVVGSGQPAGNYTGSYNITVNYQ
jgi:hypothetical protein